jgi:GxxExxY protein
MTSGDKPKGNRIAPKLKMSEIIFKEESYLVMGACFEVYKQMGCGFLEPVYQECLEKELLIRAIPFRTQVELELRYKTEPLKQKYKPDFICYEKIIIEIKSLKSLNDEHRAQVYNYLKATGFKLGLLVNFGHNQQVQYERIVL